jgi:hypothetical protein
VAPRSRRPPGSLPARWSGLTARILGTAARTGRHDPQTVKYVWHYIARLGIPGGSTEDPESGDACGGGGNSGSC